MKSFKEYLTESVEEKKYSFKIKIAGDLPEHFEDAAKAALQKYQVASFNKGKTTPIQSKLVDFPTLENLQITVFDVDLDYPTTSTVLTSYMSENTGVDLSRIRVRSLKEEEEAELNSQNLVDGNNGSLLNQEYAKENNQNIVGDKHVTSFLKELSKASKEYQPTQYKGVNEKILAKSAPKEKSAAVNKVGPAKSVLKGLSGNPNPRKGTTK
jgi:hypothetical protein